MPGLTSSYPGVASGGNGPVLFLLSTLIMGGSERKTVRLANSLASESFDVTLAYLNGPETLVDEVSPDVHLVHLDRSGIFSPRTLLRLASVVRERHVRTVVAVNLYPSLYAVLLRLWSGGRNLRVVTTVNTTDFVTGREARQMHLYRHLLKCTDRVVFGAECQRRLWRERYGIGKSTPATSVLYNGVDTGYFSDTGQWPARDPDWPKTRFVLGTVGKLRVEKSHDHLLVAVAELRRRGVDAGAVIVGDGPQYTHLKASIARLNLGEYVYMRGETDDVREYLANFDVFVLPSVAVETFSNAALEAMAMGCPVVSSDVGGMREMLQSGGGLIYRSGDIQGLTAHLEALAESPEQVLQLGQEARRVALQRFSWQQMLSGFKVDVLGLPPPLPS